MYIKIMIKDTETDRYIEHMYECTNFKYSEDDEETLFSIIHDEDNATTFGLDKPNTKVFIMNNNGVTIDSYRWTDTGTLK